MAKKTCKCGCICGVRTKKCPECNNIFYIKTKKRKEEEIDWKLLKKSEKIRVLAGSGPFYDYLDNNGKECRIYIGCSPGIYSVDSVRIDGILVYSGSLKEYIYMGPTVPGIVGVKAPHKLRLLK